MQTSKRKIPLSMRMQAILAMLRREKEAHGKIACVADIGCDHAFVSMSCIAESLADHVIAMDVRKGPLAIAQTHIQEYGFDKSVETRISDGFEQLDMWEADWAVLAGMGGELMRGILMRGRKHLEAGIGLILQPQSEPQTVRWYLQEQGYIIVDEDFLQEDGKFYTIIKAIKKQPQQPCMNMQPVEMLYGPVLLHKENKTYNTYLQLEEKKMQELRERLVKQQTASSQRRIKELDTQLNLLGEAIGLYSNDAK